MWEIDLSGQIYTFVLSLLIGVVFCLFFDLVTLIEKKLNASKKLVFFIDILIFVVFAFFDF